MPKFNKPDSPNIIWGVNALAEDLTRPDDSYIQTGWTQVKPPYEYENYSMNKLYQGFAYYNQLGIPEWDSSTEYQAGKSYVQGSNSRIYKCIQTHSNKNPASSGNDAWWKLFDSEILGSGIFSDEQFVGNIPFFQSGIKTNLKVQVARSLFTGDPQSNSGDPSSNVDHTHKAGSFSVTFPEPFNNSCVAVIPVGEDFAATSEGSEYSVGVISKSLTGASLRLTRVAGSNASNESAYIRYLAIGY